MIFVKRIIIELIANMVLIMALAVVNFNYFARTIKEHPPIRRAIVVGEVWYKILRGILAIFSLIVLLGK